MHSRTRSRSRSRVLVVALALLAFLVAPITAVAGPGSVIKGTIWADADKDQTQQSGEAKRSGVRVELIDAAGNVKATTTTDANGAYEFDNPADGIYRVRVTLPPTFTLPAAANGDNKLQLSPAVPGQPRTGVSAPIAITGNTQATGVNGGLQPVADAVIQARPRAGSCQGTATTGTPAFDATDGNGNDSSASNCLVRTGDTVTQDYQVSLNGVPSGQQVDNVIAEFTYRSPNGASLTFAGPQAGGLPNGCNTTGTPPSAIISNGDGTVTLRCNLGSFSTSAKLVSVPVRADVGSPNGSDFQISARVYAPSGEAKPTAPLTGPSVEVTGRPQWDASKGMVTGDTRPTLHTYNGVQRRGYQQKWSISITNNAPAGKGGLWLDPPFSFTDDLGFPNAVLLDCNPARPNEGAGTPTGGTIDCPPDGTVHGSNGWTMTVTSLGTTPKWHTALSYVLTVFIPVEDAYRKLEPGWQQGDPVPPGPLATANHVTKTEGWKSPDGQLNNVNGREPGWDGATATGNNAPAYTLTTDIPDQDAVGSKSYVGLTPGLHGVNPLVPDTLVGSRLLLTPNSETTLTNPVMCDVFDVSVLQLATPLGTPPAGYLFEYAEGPNTTNLENGTPSTRSPFTRPFTATDNRKAAADCRNDAGPWSQDPTTFGANWQDTVNKVRVRPIDPRRTLAPSTTLGATIPLRSRRFYNGGPHAGKEIPGGVAVPNEMGYTDPNTTDGTPGWSTAEATDPFWRMYVDAGKTGPRNANAGDQAIWTLTGELIGRTGDLVHDVTQTDTLPANLIYDAGCTTSRLPAGVTAAYNGATRTVVISYGDRVIGTRNFSLPAVQVCTTISAAATPGTTLTNNTVLDSPDSYRPESAGAGVLVNSSDELALSKDVDHPMIDASDVFTWRLTWANNSARLTFGAPDVIDVLPWNGDGANGSLSRRDQEASSFVGSHGLTGALAQPTFSRGGNGDVAGTWYYATAAPATINQDPRAAGNANPAAAGGTWQTAAEITAVGGFARVTAVRFVSTDDITPLQAVRASVPERAQGARLSNFYANRAALRSSDFPAALLSNEPTVVVPGFAVGDLVWRDDNGDGKLDGDEKGLAGVPVEVIDSTGDVVDSARTDADGRWYVDGLAPGTYRARIPASAFRDGGAADGYEPSTRGSSTASDTNENTDNNNGAPTDPTADGLTSSPVTLSYRRDADGNLTGGNGPLEDDVAEIAPDTVADDFTNFTVDLALVPRSELELVKSVTSPADGAAVSAVGDRITYRFHLTNSGMKDLDEITVTDVQAAPAGALDDGPTCPAATLAAGESMDCTATYTVTQADLDNGSVRDTATATGKDADGNPVESEESSARVPVDQVSDLEVVKSVTAPARGVLLDKVGELIAYRFHVTNTGTVTVHGLEVKDVQAAPAGALTRGPTCPVTRLEPGESTDCTATYRVQLADLEHGKVTDTATAAAVDPGGERVVSDPSSVTVRARRPAAHVSATHRHGFLPETGAPERLALATALGGTALLAGLALVTYGRRRRTWSD